MAAADWALLGALTEGAFALGDLLRSALTLRVAGLLGGVAVVGTTPAFSATTGDPGRFFAAGAVALGEDDSGGGLCGLSTRKPGTGSVMPIGLTRRGSRDADVRRCTPFSVGPSSQDVDLAIEKGTGGTSAFPDCGTFSAEAAICRGTPAAFAAAESSCADSILAFPGPQTARAPPDRADRSCSDDGGSIDASSQAGVEESPAT